jgi:hypothetical protein
MGSMLNRKQRDQRGGWGGWGEGGESNQCHQPLDGSAKLGAAEGAVAADVHDLIVFMLNGSGLSSTAS